MFFCIWGSKKKNQKTKTKTKKKLDHYLIYHNIDSNNWFFQKLFQSDNKPFLKNWKDKAKHDFLKHYSDGKNIPFEEKPLYIVRYPALTIYQIEYKKYSNLYPFFNSEKCVEEFLKNVKHRFHTTS